MARSTKNARHIKVGDVDYRWRATGSDGWISLTVWPAAETGPCINCHFCYHGPGDRDSVGNELLLGNQIVITNRIVRRVIDYATSEHGYNPLIRGQQLNLWSVDEKIDLSDAVRAGNRSQS